jgi:hypothetical protein
MIFILLKGSTAVCVPILYKNYLPDIAGQQDIYEINDIYLRVFNNFF